MAKGNHLLNICKKIIKGKSKFHILWVFVIHCSAANSTVRYVKQNGSETADGSSWLNASSNLQAMIDISTINDEVWVAGGAYKPQTYPSNSSSGVSSRDFAFIIKNQVKIFGGFSGTETSLAQRTAEVIASNPSILSGDIGQLLDNNDNTYHVVFSVDDDSSTIFDGFVIANGNANGSNTVIIENISLYRNYGAGMYIYNSSALIKNCIFFQNNAKNGGGIYNSYDSSPTITNCSFLNNTAINDGGGLYNYYLTHSNITGCKFSSNSAAYGGGIYNFTGTSSPLISNCVFSNNTVSGGGGGIANVGCSPQIINCFFIANNANTGGGIVNISYQNPQIITNCVFHLNTSQLGGGIANIDSSPIIKNSTFSKNIADRGGGVYNEYLATNPNIWNSIFFKNNVFSSANVTGADIENDILSNAKTTVQYTMLQLPNNNANYPVNGNVSGFQGIGIGNIYNISPLFNDEDNPSGIDNILGTKDDGLSLQNCSPSINAGNNLINTEVIDIISELRINFFTIDMGAYENKNFQVSLTDSILSEIGIFQGTQIIATNQITNSNVKYKI